MKIFDVVATLCEHPEGQIGRGQVGTIVEELDREHVLVEFADLNGATYATLSIPVAQLLKLKHAPTIASISEDAHGLRPEGAPLPRHKGS